MKNKIVLIELDEENKKLTFTRLHQKPKAYALNSRRASNVVAAQARTPTPVRNFQWLMTPVKFSGR